MALRYHYSTRKHAWRKCVAASDEACHYRSDAHGDRTSIAAEHGGGVVAYHQTEKDRQGRVVSETVKQFTVTPVIEGVYGVIGLNGSARTYRADTGELIPYTSRSAYLQEVILPRVRARHEAAMRGEAYVPPSSGRGPVSTRPQPLELPASILTEPTLRPGEAGRKAREELAAKERELEWAGRRPTKTEVAKREAKKRKGIAGRLLSLFQRSSAAQAAQSIGASDAERRESGRAPRETLFDWFYDAFGVR